MELSALTPPNRFAFSDTVIGNVMQSTRKARVNSTAHIGDVRGHVEKRPYQQRARYRHAPYQPSKQTSPYGTPENPIKVEPVSNGTAILSSIAELIGQTDSSTGRKRASCLSSDLKTANEIIASIQGTNHHITNELQQAIVAEALKKKIRHRERCRINQARYRKRQMRVETAIEDVITKLKSEIDDLEARCKDSSRLPTTPTLWTIAAEYLRHFNYYVSSPATLQPTVSKYLHGIMAPDVIVGSKFGVEAQLENWKLFALYFDDIQLELRGMNMPTSDMLVAHTMINVTITSNTLRRVFPHLNSDGCGGTKGGSWSPLATKMLDQKVVMRGSVVFGWDNATDKIVRVQFQADLMTPMIQLLGNLRNVTCVFEKARVTPDCDFVRREDN